MLVILALALVLVGVAIGAAGLRTAGRLSRRLIGPWRPGVGAGALICFFGAAALVVRGAAIEGAALAAFGLVLAVVARRRPAVVSRPSGMARDEARRILGLEVGADKAAIDAAYRRLMQRAHPDLGGTAGLAAQLNAAREALTRAG